MRKQEPYWQRSGQSRRGSQSPATPDLRDLPAGTFAGDEQSWNSLSPSYRRAIWRDAIIRAARNRGLDSAVIERLKIAIIDGSIPDLDGYLLLFEMRDAKRPAISEDAARIARADSQHQQMTTQIAGREAL